MIFETVVVGPLEVNCFILGCETTRKGIVVDPGDNADKVIAAVERHKLTIEKVINTHAHFDHTGANRRIRDHFGAKLLVHADDLPLLQRATTSASSFGLKAESSPDPDQYLEDGMIITFGDCSMKVLHTPGHSMGGCCLYLEAENKIITGDTLFCESIGRTDFAGGSFEDLISSVRTKIFTLPDHTVAYPGHGPETTVAHEKKHNPYF